MADKLLKSVVGGGVFIDGSFSGGLTHSLSSASPLTITPSGSGKSIRLEKLAGGATVSNVTVSVGGRTVINNLTLAFSASSVGGGAFLISNGEADNSSVANMPGARNALLCDAGESIVVSTTQVAAVTIAYSFTESA